MLPTAESLAIIAIVYDPCEIFTSSLHSTSFVKSINGAVYFIFIIFFPGNSFAIKENANARLSSISAAELQDASFF